MKKLLYLAAPAFAALASPALATNCPSNPYTLTNGTTADANQVMSNFNNILTCTNLYLAHSGVNSDITALTALTSVPGGVTVSGGWTFSSLVTSTLATGQLNSMVFADQQVGSDMGAKINSALALLPAGGGIVDARGLLGAQTLSTPVTIGANQTVILGSATITASATITIGANGSLVGVPTGPGVATAAGASRIVQAASANLPELILLNGLSATLRDVIVDGTKATNTGAGPNIMVQGQWDYIAGVTSQNSHSHGIELLSTGTTDQACCASIHDVMSINNGGDGLYSIGTSDTIIGQSYFENNTGSAGVELYDSPAARLSNYDIGGNQLGVWVHGHDYSAGVYPGSNAQIIGVGQFGNNYKQDILIDGTGTTNAASWGNMINGPILIGSIYRTPNTYAAIEINNSSPGGNTISGVNIDAHQTQEFTNAVYIHGAAGADTVGDVRTTGTFGGATFNVPTVTALNFACDTTAALCYGQNQRSLKPVFTGNATGYAMTAQTAGANAADQYASVLFNPSTASFATVTQTFADGTGALSQLYAQRNGTGTGTWLFLATEKAGTMTAGVKMDDNQLLSFLASGYATCPVLNTASNVVGCGAFATGAQVIAGVSTTAVVTPASLTSGSAPASGYSTAPGGQITQGGVSGTVTSGGGTLTVTYPKAFTTATTSVVITPTTNPGGTPAYAVTAQTATTFTILNQTTGNLAFNWIAIGY